MSVKDYKCFTVSEKFSEAGRLASKLRDLVIELSDQCDVSKKICENTVIRKSRTTASTSSSTSKKTIKLPKTNRKIIIGAGELIGELFDLVDWQAHDDSKLKELCGLYIDHARFEKMFDV